MDTASAHRNSERVRHRRLHFFLNSAANYVPKLPDRKETKVQKLRRVILYLAYLTKLKNKYLNCSEENKKTDDQKCEESSNRNKIQLVKQRKANIVFLGNKHLEKNHPDKAAPIQDDIQKCKVSFRDNYKIKTYDSEGYSLWELKDRMFSKLKHKFCLENPVTDQVKSMQNRDFGKCFARKRKMVRKNIVCKSECFKKPHNKHPKDLHVLHKNAETFDHIKTNSVNYGPLPCFKSLVNPFDYAAEFNPSEKFISNDCQDMLYEETFPCTKSSIIDKNELPCSKLENADYKHWNLKKNCEQTISAETTTGQSATRYLMRNLSSGSSERLEDECTNDFDCFMENFDDFNYVPLKCDGKSNKRGTGNSSTFCDGSSFAEFAKTLSTSELSPNDAYINSDNLFGEKCDYFFPTQQNEMSHIEASDEKTFDYNNLCVPQNNSVLSKEIDDNWMFFVPIKHEENLDCQQKSLSDPIDFEPYLPLNEISTSFNFMNKS